MALRLRVAFKRRSETVDWDGKPIVEPKLELELCGGSRRPCWEFKTCLWKKQDNVPFLDEPIAPLGLIESLLLAFIFRQIPKYPEHLS